MSGAEKDSKSAPHFHSTLNMEEPDTEHETWFPPLSQSLSITLCRRMTTGEREIITAPLLEEAGHQVIQVGDEVLTPSADGVLWILGNANWFPKTCRRLSAVPKPERPLVVLWHYEPLPPPSASGLPWPRLNKLEIAKILLRDRRASDVYSNYWRLRRLVQKGLPNVLTVSTPGRQEFLSERGITSHHVPLGHDPFYGHDMGLIRDIDVLFLGDLRIPRRKRLIKRLRRNGVTLEAVGSWFDPTFWGENRTRLLNRTRVLLNIQRYPGELSGSRLILALANKALPISEPMYSPAPYVPGKHFVSATIEEMPEAIEYYLTHNEERKRIVDEGHRLVTQKVTMKRSISRILELIGEHIG